MKRSQTPLTDATPKKHGLVSNTAHVLGLFWRWRKSSIVIIAADAALAVLAPFFAIYLPKLVLQQIAEGVTADRMILSIGGFTLLAVAVFFLGRYMGARRFWLGHAYRNMESFLQFMRKLMVCDYATLESAQGQTLIQKLMPILFNGDWSPFCKIPNAVASLAAGVLGFFLYSGVLAGLGPWLVALLVVMSCASYFTLRHANNYDHKLKDEWAPVEKKIWYLGEEAENFATAKDIRMYNMGAWFGGLLRDLLGRRIKWDFMEQHRRFLMNIINALNFLVRDGLAYAYLIYAALDGRVSVADFALYFGAIAGFAQWIERIIQQVSELNGASLEIDDYRAFFGQQDRPDPDPATPLPARGPLSVEFEDVCFTYPGAQTPTLDHINVRIEPGRRVALVGVNGAGKTTLVKLLCGFYRPDSGRILINGTDYTRFKRDDLLELFSAVFQESFQLPLTIKQNVAMTPYEEIDEARVLRCLELAGLKERVLLEPEGLDAAMLKVSSENGVVFSGGETQKLLLARALYKDAPILLLDEPTAALDPIAESEVYARYNEMTRGKTSIYISHRLASTRFCDAVLLLKEGRIAERGTHDELLALGGEYARIFGIQSHYYQKHVAGAEGVAVHG